MEVVKCLKWSFRFRTVTLPVDVHYKRKFSSSQRKRLIKELKKLNISASYPLKTIEAVGYQKSDIDKFEDEENVPFAETFTGNCCWNFFPCRDNKKIGRHTFAKVIFAKGYETLEKYMNGDFIESEEMLAVSALERFVEEKEIHERSLSALTSDGSDETEAKSRALLTNHLLAQLLPTTSYYFLDKTTPGITDVCLCGCGENIQLGTTYIGSPRLFYGPADIVLFPGSNNMFFEVDNSKCAIFSWKKTTPENMRNSNNQENNNYEKNKSMTDLVESHASLNNVNKLYKQAIALSIYKYKGMTINKEFISHDSLETSMIPVCAINGTSYDVVLYDAQNDFLLKMDSDGSKLFDDNRLKFSAILDLWFVIHHHLFCSMPPGEVVADLKNTCGLIPRLGEERFASIVKTSEWASLIIPDDKTNHSQLYTLYNSRPAGGKIPSNLLN
ncbi:uncharacterized protein LOC133178799 [Saccostrea echinata]|uniref:uncharacterized protein LOC133178799 n=1 Tax=Saccostrea echinata TaxID=191078 RepID=UPI002A7F148F|nr:uncharacterized protein LOC133178799 [Saccostrea echinata]